MPKEIFDKEEFLALSEGADECRIKNLGDVMKLKIRTSTYLYTIRLPYEEAEELRRRLDCPVIDV